MVSKRCKTCKYRGYDANFKTHCYYVMHTGELRNCPSGDDCTKYAPDDNTKIKNEE